MTKDEIMQAALNRLCSELRECRKLFQMYGDQHISKDPPQTQKAQTNYAQVASIHGSLVHVGELLALHKQLEDAEAEADRREILELVDALPGSPVRSAGTETFVPTLDQFLALSDILLARDSEDTVLVRMSIATLRTIATRAS